jgi:hypothetical protein
MFLDPSDFEDTPFRIPNQEESRDLQNFIDRKEAEYLKKVLGLSFYNAFIAGLDTSGTVEQIWVDLRDGKEYTYSNTDYEYTGVKELLKPVIYSDWLDANYRKLSNGGMIVNDGQNNTTAVNPIDEIVFGWNEFVQRVGGLCYPYQSEGDLRGFMLANADAYEDWDSSKAQTFRFKNSLNL